MTDQMLLVDLWVRQIPDTHRQRIRLRSLAYSLDREIGCSRRRMMEDLAGCLYQEYYYSPRRYRCFPHRHYYCLPTSLGVLALMPLFLLLAAAALPLSKI